jgi:hypothetical protein
MQLVSTPADCPSTRVFLLIILTINPMNQFACVHDVMLPTHAARPIFDVANAMQVVELEPLQ